MSSTYFILRVVGIPTRLYNDPERVVDALKTSISKFANLPDDVKGRFADYNVFNPDDLSKLYTVEEYDEFPDEVIDEVFDTELFGPDLIKELLMLQLQYMDFAELVTP